MADGYPKAFTVEQFLAAVVAQLQGAGEGWISLNRVASELGMTRRHAQLTFEMLQRSGVIQVLETKRGSGTRVRIPGQNGGAKVEDRLHPYRSGYPRDLRDSDPDGSLSGPVRTYRLTDEELRALGGQNSRPSQAQTPAPAPPQPDDWEPVYPYAPVKRELWVRLLPNGGIALSAGATRALYGDQTGEARVRLDISQSRRMARVRIDPEGPYRTTFKPPAQVNARIGAERLTRVLGRLGARVGMAYEAEEQDAWVVIDFKRPHEEVQAS